MSNLKRQSDLEALHPFVKQQALKVLDDCKTAGLNVDIFEALRTLERQKWLKSTGKSQTLSSYHRLGLAVDFVFKTDNGNWTWNKPNEDWDALATICEKHGFKSGWRWKRFRDGPHAQMQFEGYRSTSLYKMLDECENNLGLFYNEVDLLLGKDPNLKKLLPKVEPIKVTEIKGKDPIEDTFIVKPDKRPEGSEVAEPSPAPQSTGFWAWIISLFGGK